MSIIFMTSHFPFRHSLCSATLYHLLSLIVRGFRAAMRGIEGVSSKIGKKIIPVYQIGHFC